MARRLMIELSDEVRVALEVLARDRRMTPQEIGAEAVQDYLARQGRPTNLREALAASAGEGAPKAKRSGRRGRK